MKKITNFNKLSEATRDIEKLNDMLKMEIQRHNGKDEVANTILNEIINTCNECLERKNQ